MSFYGMPQSPDKGKVASAAEGARQRREAETQRILKIKPTISSDVDRIVLQSMAWHTVRHCHPHCARHPRTAPPLAGSEPRSRLSQGAIIPSAHKWEVADGEKSAPVSAPGTPPDGSEVDTAEPHPDPLPPPPPAGTSMFSSFSSHASSIERAQTAPANSSRGNSFAADANSSSYGGTPSVLPAEPWWPATTNYSQQAQKMRRKQRRESKAFKMFGCAQNRFRLGGAPRPRPAETPRAAPQRGRGRAAGGGPRPAARQTLLDGAC